MSPRKPPDVDALVSRHWPYDGPYSPELLLSGARMLPELVRYINNSLTNASDSVLFDPAIVGLVIGQLQAAVKRTEEALDLIGRRCHRWEDPAVLTCTGGVDAASEELTAVQDILDQAAVKAASTADLLSQAHSLVNRLYFRED